MAHIIALTNQKGGVGKTTTAINLSAGLAKGNKRTLLVDIDPQANSTSGLGVARNLRRSFYHVLVMNEPLDNIIIKSELENLLLAPADRNLAGAEIELVDIESRELKLKSILESQGIKIKHPNILPILDYGYTDSISYLVSEFTIGISLFAISIF